MSEVKIDKKSSINKYTIRLIGRPSVTKGSEIIELPFRKAEALLYYLAVVKHALRDDVTELLWPDLDDDRAKANLRNALYVLRKHCCDDIVLTSGGTELELNRNRIESIDYDEWLRDEAQILLDDAVPLNGFVLRGNDAFDKWVTWFRLTFQADVKKRLDRRFADPSLDGEELETLLHFAIGMDPLNESLYRRLIILLSNENRTGEAVSLYQQLCEILQSELSVSPSRETSKLIHYIRHSTESLHENGDSRVLPFTGRDREIARLMDLQKQVQQTGQSARLLILGEAGSGKTRLIQEWARIACIHPDTMYSFRGVHGRNTLQIAAGQSAPPDCDLLVRQLRDDLHLRYLIVDDLQWIDATFLECLDRMMLEMIHRPVTMIMMSRFLDNPMVTNFLDTQERLAPLETVRLEPPEKADVFEAVKQNPHYRGLTDTKLSILMHKADNNIGFFNALLDDEISDRSTDRPNTTLRYLCESQLFDFSEKEKDLLRKLALFQQFIPYQLVFALAETDRDEVTSMLDRMIKRHILHEETYDHDVLFSFNSRALQHYLESTQSLVRQIESHARIAELYEGLLTFRLDDMFLYPQIIYHYSKSGNTYKTLEYTLKLSRQE